METILRKAFAQIKREDFVPQDLKQLAAMDEALPIGSGQTISQPFTVAFMLEKLQPKPGDKILDVGSGSGWTSALLAYIVSGGELKSKIKDQKSKINGKIVAIEVIPELKEFGERNVAKYNFIKKGIVTFLCRNGAEGYEKEAPYDDILVSASLATKELPEPWKKQLKVGGRIIVPIQNSIWKFTKENENRFTQEEYPGFVFVPFV